MRVGMVLFLTAVTLLTYAPPAPPAGNAPPCWPPPCIPLDGGISVLLAVGALFGVRKGIQMAKNT